MRTVSKITAAWPILSAPFAITYQEVVHVLCGFVGCSVFLCRPGFTARTLARKMCKFPQGAQYQTWLISSRLPKLAA